MKTAEPLQAPVPGVAVWQWTPSELLGLPPVTVERAVFADLADIARRFAGSPLVCINGRVTPRDRND